jgi:hypothetical protein
MQTSQTAAKASSDVYRAPYSPFLCPIHEGGADELTYGALILKDLGHVCSARDRAVYPFNRIR